MMILMARSENNSSGVFIIDLITGEFFIYVLDIDIVMDLKYESSDLQLICVTFLILLSFKILFMSLLKCKRSYTLIRT